MPFEILIRIMELVLNNYKIQLEITLFLSKISPLIHGEAKVPSLTRFFRFFWMMRRFR